MSLTETSLPGVWLIEPKKFHDHRGYFFEMFRESTFSSAGLELGWVQDNASFSHKGVLRGLHYQWPNPQGKLVQAVVGEIWDVAVDIRVGSPHYGKWHAEVLSEENRHQLWIPPGFAHGFVALSETALVTYKCTAYFDAAGDAGVRYDDPALAVEWPVTDVMISDKDRGLPLLADVPEAKRPIY